MIDDDDLFPETDAKQQRPARKIKKRAADKDARKRAAVHRVVGNIPNGYGSQQHQYRQPQQHQQQYPDENEKRTSPIDHAKEVAESIKGQQANVLYEKAMIWLYEHPLVLVLAGIISIAIGLLVSRYISFAAAFLFLFIGFLMSRDDEKDPLLCYGIAVGVFLIPYMF